MTDTGNSNVPRVIAQPLNWNAWEETADCIRSLLTQDYPNLHVRVIDNGSDDDSTARLRAGFPGLDLMENGWDLGYAAGQNTGLRRALEENADYVLLLNNDLKFDPDAVSAMVAVAEQSPTVGAVSVVMRYQETVDEIQFWGGGRLIRWRGKLINCHRPEERLDYLSAACLLLRVEAVREVGLLDERFFLYWEDVDYSVRLTRSGWQLAVADRAGVRHRGSASYGNRSSARDGFIAESTVRFLRKHLRVSRPSIAVSIGLRLGLRLAHGDWDYFMSTWRGARAGLQPPTHLPPQATSGSRGKTAGNGGLVS